ncbi:cytochrome P450 [Henriciella sp.]|uniref:cytochrome P450 n=1 Tax=Henriciella sp. TaxID=1968823 RepID=UPI0026149E0F|nr:cytochrome P450 [Henriciella sp.]
MLTDNLNLDAEKLIDIDLGSAKTKANMQQLAAGWATMDPFYVRSGGHVIVICGRYADVNSVYQDTDRFSTELPKGPGFEVFDKFMGVQVLAQMDGEKHMRIRRLMGPAFSPRAAAALEGGIAQSVELLLDEIQREGQEFDAVKQYASHLIVETLLTVMLNLTEDQKQVFLRMHDAIPKVTYADTNEGFPQDCVDAFIEAQSLINEMIAERRQRPKEDLISNLIHARDESGKLSDQELFDQIFTICAGALSATTVSFTNTLYALYLHPEAVGQLKMDKSLIPSAMDECQRWQTGGYLTFPRFALQDTVIGGTPVSKGMIVRVCPQAAHYDPTVYPDPLRFDIHRGGRNIVFGTGPHHCVGFRVARLAIRIALERLISRFPDARLKDTDMVPTYGGAVGEMKINSLPMLIR